MQFKFLEILKFLIQTQGKGNKHGGNLHQWAMSNHIREFDTTL